VGPKKAAALLKRYGSLTAIAAAPVDGIADAIAVKGEAALKIKASAQAALTAASSEKARLTGPDKSARRSRSGESRRLTYQSPAELALMAAEAGTGASETERERDC
jgi:hypothetical protein